MVNKDRVRVKLDEFKQKNSWYMYTGYIKLVKDVKQLN